MSAKYALGTVHLCLEGFEIDATNEQKDFHQSG
jgi:hypothetical protein